MVKADRTIDRYDPRVDAAERWPNWTIIATNLGGIPEIICKYRQILLVDPGHDRSEDMAVAQGIAHLDLGHQDAPGVFTMDQQWAARAMAAIRMDSPAARVPHIPDEDAAAWIPDL
jgi:hypothetical protein